MFLVGAGGHGKVVADKPEKKPLQRHDKPEPAEGQAKVQIAILLDTSGSMSGLIEQTKAPGCEQAIQCALGEIDPMAHRRRRFETRIDLAEVPLASLRRF